MFISKVGFSVFIRENQEKQNISIQNYFYQWSNPGNGKTFGSSRPTKLNVLHRNVFLRPKEVIYPKVSKIEKKNTKVTREFSIDSQLSRKKVHQNTHLKTTCQLTHTSYWERSRAPNQSPLSESSHRRAYSSTTEWTLKIMPPLRLRRWKTMLLPVKKTG